MRKFLGPGIVLFFIVLSPASFAFDRLGSDIGLAVTVANANACNTLCNGNPSCQAWVLVNPGNSRFGNTAPLCFLKNAIPPPSFNTTCPTNAACVSGIKRTDGWCGETPAREVAAGILGQDAVLTCMAGVTCGPKMMNTSKTTVCWFLFFPYPCHETVKVQTTDFFCVPPPPAP